jgi:hypothetical protein
LSVIPASNDVGAAGQDREFPLAACLQLADCVEKLESNAIAKNAL